jgi:hypothetical protein
MLFQRPVSSVGRDNLRTYLFSSIDLSRWTHLLTIRPRGLFSGRNGQYHQTRLVVAPNPKRHETSYRLRSFFPTAGIFFFRRRPANEQWRRNGLISSYAAFRDIDATSCASFFGFAGQDNGTIDPAPTGLRIVSRKIPSMVPKALASSFHPSMPSTVDICAGWRAPQRATVTPG